ncbi:efflux RND transporter periplasmic adaptor subunit [Robertkochia solimangrovi]|uniref:efflux RND transporter periplasmic adaptor subunit n=1 Tax=Robertkochia solimangrovi TaxID=2213046 RepID=UPI00117C94B0|nr:efflux RND transporter periplasmic adaptor subunit [Robertkochia solimangrovi]TRZ45769.1 efflux transporter periplasmic adaptor subunit [Robertkochia solimangrovi]
MKIVKYLGIAVFIIALMAAFYYLVKSNAKSPITFTSETPFRTTIEEKTVATGKVVPEDEVLIKPQISGIIEKIFVEEGDKLKANDLIAKIKVVPNEQSLVSARGRVRNAEITLSNAKTEFDRNKTLFDRGVVSNQDFMNIELQYNQAKQELENAKNDYQIIKEGSAGGSATANTNIRASIAGTVLEIPVDEGHQVIEANNFNDGTTIATIADMSQMIFEGQVDEAEVGKLKVGMPLKISLGAIQDQELDAELRFIAPKGVEESGAVQFTIKADVNLDSTNVFIRAGYSANATMILDKKEDVLAIKEALLQYDAETQKPYVEVVVGDQKFERKDVELGLSDGINVEIKSGVTESDKIKVWNQTEPVKRETDENN